MATLNNRIFTNGIVQSNTSTLDEITKNPGYGSVNFNKYALSATSQYSTIPHSGQLVVGASENFTIEFWINTRAVTSTGTMCAFSTNNNGGASGHVSFFVGHSAFGASQYLLYWKSMPSGTGGTGTTSDRLTSVPNFTTGSWVHIAIVRTGGQNVVFYIDGTQTANVTYNGAIISSTNTWWLGVSGDSTTNTNYNGYLSNFRFVKGVGVYTGNFTVPRGQLKTTQSSSTNVAAITTSSSSYLLLNTFVNSANGVFRDTSDYKFSLVPTSTILAPLPNASSPFTPNPAIPYTSLDTTAKYSVEFDEVFSAPGCVYFNGTTDYITATLGNIDNLGAGAVWNYSNRLGSSFTIECWFNCSTAAATARPIFDLRSPDTANLGFDILLSSSNILQVTTSGSTWITGTNILQLKQWYHVAFVRNGNLFSLYLNGVLEGAFTGSVTQNITNNIIRIGFGANANYFNGYISNYRIVNKPLYTSTFTPPLNQLTPVGTYDSFSINNGSLALNSNTPYCALSTVPVPSGPMTLECFFYATDPASLLAICSWGNGGSNFRLFLTNGTQLTVWTGTTSYAVTPGYSMLNKWTHIAVVREAVTTTGNVRMYVDGTKYTPGAGFTTPWDASTTLRIGADIQDTTNYTFKGYISNWRLVKGVEVYYTNFTPPTKSLTATQAANTNGFPSAAITGTQTVLLYNFNNNITFLNDASSNSNTLTATGGITFATNSSAFSPFNSNLLLLNTPYSTGGTFSDTNNRPNTTITVTGSRTSNNFYPDTYNLSNYGSIILNGTTDYITAPSSTLFAFGSSVDFTVECWVYLTAYSGSIYGAAAVGTTNGAQTGWMLNVGEAADRLRIISNASGTWGDNLVCSAGNGVQLNIWTHIAMVRAGNSLYLFKNGQLAATALTGVNTWNFTSPSNIVNIGYTSDGTSGTRFFKGCIADVRIVKGTALYTSAFTQPTVPLSAVTGTSLLLNMVPTASQYLADSSGNNLALTKVGTSSTNGGAKISYLSPYNNNPGSIVLNGSSTYLTIGPPSNGVFSYGTGDFTAEFWIYKTASADGAILDMFAGAGVAGTLGVYFTATTIFCSQTNNGAQQFIFTHTLSLNSWNHVALSRYSGNIYCYVNGLLVGSAVCTANFTTVAGLTIGRNPGGNNQYFNGYLSNLRIVKGIGVYTGNFEVPKNPLKVTQSASTNVAAIPSGTTVFLLPTSLSSNNHLIPFGANTVVQSGAPAQTEFNPFFPRPASLVFNGSTQWLTLPTSTLFSFGTGDYTAEFWINLKTLPASKYTILDFRLANGATPHTVYVSSTGYFGYYNGSADVTSSSLPIVINTWYHVAYSRIAGTLNIYVSGSSAYSAANAIDYGSSNKLTIGASVEQQAGEFVNGYLSNIRIVKGLGVYTGNFEPPAMQLSVTQNASSNIAAITGTSTSLLIDVRKSLGEVKDLSTNNLVITKNYTSSSNTSFVSSLSPLSDSPRFSLTPVQRVLNTSKMQNYGFIDEVTTII